MAALIKVDKPKNNPAKYIYFFEFEERQYFNKKNKLKVKRKRNNVSERICELMIIINGEKIAKIPVSNSYFLFNKPAHRNIITQVTESNNDCNTKTKNRLLQFKVQRSVFKFNKKTLS